MRSDEITEAIITTRDFCGDERAAAADAMEAAGMPITPETVSEAVRQADNEWREYQRCAGVTRPITANERRRINHDLK